MALEATGRSYEAQDIYKVLRRSKNSSIKGQAKRLAVFFYEIRLGCFGGVFCGIKGFTVQRARRWCLQIGAKNGSTQLVCAKPTRRVSSAVWHTGQL